MKKQYLLMFEWFDKTDTTTSDGFSGGSVGWVSAHKPIEAKNNDEAAKKARELLKSYGCPHTVRNIKLYPPSIKHRLLYLFDEDGKQTPRARI